MYNAMEARCYDGTLCFLSREKKTTRRQYVLTAVYMAVLIAVGMILNIKG